MLKIFLMTKNEELLIEDWIKYHGFLFGFENIHIIDGSNSQRVFDIYGKYEPKGLNIHYSNANLNEVTDVINDLMHKHKGENNFLIKMDTDEFLAYRRPSLFLNLHSASKAPTLSRSYWRKCLSKIFTAGYYMECKCMDVLYQDKQLRNDEFRNFLKKLPITGQRYKANFTMFSIPKNKDVQDPCSEITSFMPIQHYFWKSFFHSKSFRSVDAGGHGGVTDNNKGEILTGLTIIHYHAISVEDSLRRTRQVLISHGYIGDGDGLELCRKKLLKVKASTNWTSHHRVGLYLTYIDSIQSGKVFSAELFSWVSPGAVKTNRIYKSTLVKDTLAAINQMDNG